MVRFTRIHFTNSLTRLTRSLRSFSYADRIDAQYVVLVAPSEWENGRVKVKNMRLPEDAADKEVEVRATACACVL